MKSPPPVKRMWQVVKEREETSRDDEMYESFDFSVKLASCTLPTRVSESACECVVPDGLISLTNGF